MATLQKRHTYKNGGASYSMSGIKASVYVGPKMFDGPAPDTIDFSAGNRATPGVDNSAAKAQAKADAIAAREAKKTEKATAREAVKAQRDAAKAEKAEKAIAAKAQRETVRQAKKDAAAAAKANEAEAAKTAAATGASA